MPTYRYHCNNCDTFTDKFFDVKNRKKMVKCDKCGGDAYRIFTIGAGYIKKNFVGDEWDRRGIEPVKENDPDSETRKVNHERIKKIRNKDK